MSMTPGATERTVDVVLGGLPLHIRPIRPEDRVHLVAGMSLLSERSRYLRFFTPTEELTDDQLDYFSKVDGVSHIAFIAFTPEGGADRVVGTVRAIRNPDDPTSAEISVTVGDSFQRRGIGTLLVRVLAEEARAAGIRRFTALVLADNVAMLTVFRRFGAQMGFDPAAGAITVSLELGKVPLLG